MTTKDLYRRVLDRRGFANQLFKCFEEIAEAEEAMLKFRDAKDTKDHVCEEIADAQIMLEQMAHFYDAALVKEYRKAKLARLEARIKNDTLI